MNIFLSFGIGVFSAVFSAVLILTVRTLVLKHFLPWYFDAIYRGIRIDGEWYASCIHMAQDIQLSLNQRAGLLSGSAILAMRPSDADPSRDFEADRQFLLEGRIQDRYITISLSHKNRQRIGVISFLLEPIRDGRQLEGQMSFVSVRHSGIDSIPIKLAREKSLVVEGREAEEASLAQMIEDSTRQAQLPLEKPKRRPRKPSAPQVKGDPPDAGDADTTADTEPVFIQ